MSGIIRVSLSKNYFKNPLQIKNKIKSGEHRWEKVKVMTRQKDVLRSGAALCMAWWDMLVLSDAMDWISGHRLVYRTSWLVITHICTAGDVTTMKGTILQRLVNYASLNCVHAWDTYLAKLQYDWSSILSTTPFVLNFAADSHTAQHRDHTSAAECATLM